MAKGIISDKLIRPYVSVGKMRKSEFQMVNVL